ncbi:MAG: hypothetical protein GVY20_11285 [Bacteroidetes bacterium]|jgi:hypothetical protein|nr:hypothetical protein [Bacteroidota bacterium]
MNTTKTFLIFFLCLSLFGCSGNLLESKIKEINSGTYRVSGIQVELTYDFSWPSWGGEEVILSKDTTDIEFMMEVKYEKGRQDSVRFYRAGRSRAGCCQLP